jgi:SEC-C motif domain protein
MRSRYTAYVLELTSYLLETWHPDTRPAHLDFSEEPKPQWLGLSVKAHDRVGTAEATVEFVARYKTGGRAHRLKELSRFVHLGGKWYYVDGRLPGDAAAPAACSKNPAA